MGDPQFLYQICPVCGTTVRRFWISSFEEECISCFGDSMGQSTTVTACGERLLSHVCKPRVDRQPKKEDNDAMMKSAVDTTKTVFERSKSNIGSGLQVGAGRKVAKRMNTKMKEALVRAGVPAEVLNNQVIDALIYMIAPAALMAGSAHLPILKGPKPQRVLDYAQIGGSSIIGEDLSDVVEEIFGPMISSMGEVLASSLGEDAD